MDCGTPIHVEAFPWTGVPQFYVEASPWTGDYVSNVGLAMSGGLTSKA